MAGNKKTPQPLFDNYDNLQEYGIALQPYLSQLKIPGASQEHQLCSLFLRQYAANSDTFTAYRREVERILQWCWLIKHIPLIAVTRNELIDYLQFITHPPKTWIGHKVFSRFTKQAGQRVANPNWRPFVNKIAKADKHTLQPPKAYQLSQKSTQAILAILSSLFTFLQQENYLQQNPVLLLRQKKAYIQSIQTVKVVRKLSHTQWRYVITIAEQLAHQSQQHERSLFLISTFYLLGLRISELAYNKKHQARMNSFNQDKQGLWWFTTLGKGNKWRDVAVPNELLNALKRYRQSLNLSSLPSASDNQPLLPHLNGRSGLGTRQIRNIVQQLFDLAIEKLKQAQQFDEAHDLANATVHWLRHTAISHDIEFRPRDHVRDDVGHSNPATLEKYIDIDRHARHASAQKKQLKPEKLTHNVDDKNSLY